MKPREIKDLINSSLNANYDSASVPEILEQEGISFNFSNGFKEKVLNKIFSEVYFINRELEFARSVYFVFNRIALTGVAAIVALLISIYLIQGSLSFDSFLGLKNNYEESIISMLTGN
jgi:hypothetical protein